MLRYRSLRRPDRDLRHSLAAPRKIDAQALLLEAGPMDCGKSTLALQLDYNHARQGRHGLLLTRLDRSGPAQISSRMGLSRPAVEVDDEMDLGALVRRSWAQGWRRTKPLDSRRDTTWDRRARVELVREAKAVIRSVRSGASESIAIVKYSKWLRSASRRSCDSRVPGSSSTTAISFFQALI